MDFIIFPSFFDWLIFVFYGKGIFLYFFCLFVFTFGQVKSNARARDDELGKETAASEQVNQEGGRGSGSVHVSDGSPSLLPACLSSEQFPSDITRLCRSDSTLRQTRVDHRQYPKAFLDRQKRYILGTSHPT